MKKLTLFLLLTGSTFLFGQNLVPNPSFEDYSSCPTEPSELYLSDYWSMPSNTDNASTDLYNSCNATTVSVPSNLSGYQEARTGNGYVGVYTYGDEVREYVQAQLTSPMSAGIPYKIEMYVSPSEVNNYSTDGMGIHISTGSISGNGNYLLLFTPQVANPIGNIISDTASWTLVSGIYTASGGEDYITIGNFLDDANTDTLQTNPNGFLGRGYYWIDDVSIEKAVGLDELPSASLNIHPNPATGQIAISLEGGTINALTLRNSIGQTLFTENSLTGGQLALDLATYPSGIYFLECKAEGEVIIRKVVKE